MPPRLWCARNVGGCSAVSTAASIPIRGVSGGCRLREHASPEDHPVRQPPWFMAQALRPCAPRCTPRSDAALEAVATPNRRNGTPAAIWRDATGPCRGCRVPLLPGGSAAVRRDASG